MRKENEEGYMKEDSQSRWERNKKEDGNEDESEAGEYHKEEGGDRK